MKNLCTCNYCGGNVYEPEIRSCGNPHARNVCPFCGAELEDKYVDYRMELVSDSYYDNTPKQRCHPNYLH